MTLEEFEILDISTLSDEEIDLLILEFESSGNKECSQVWVDYNIKDTDLVYRIEEKTKLISLIMTMTYQSGVNFNDTFGTTKIWDTIIYRRLIKDKVVVQPNKSKAKGSYEGAYVKEPIKGKYKWVMSFDLNSLYPNIIAQYNMSPETYVRDHAIQLSVEKCLARDVPKLEYTIAPNGSLYRKDKQGVVPQIIVEYYNRRKAIQKKQNKLEAELELETNEARRAILEAEIDRLYNRQMSIKLLLNSFYGALANAYFRHFELMIAEGITMGGQLTIKWAERAINEYLNKALKTNDVDYVIAIDTDSVVGDSLINVDGKDITIADFYNNSPDDFLRNDSFNNDYVKIAKGITPSVNKDGNLEFRNIKYVMKHKVKKKMFKIKCNGKEVTVTEDHSIIVKENGEIKSIKPELLRPGFHEIINIVASDTESNTIP